LSLKNSENFDAKEFLEMPYICNVISKVPLILFDIKSRCQRNAKIIQYDLLIGNVLKNVTPNLFRGLKNNSVINI